ncbi:MAG TPA: ABC transporter ATP-binding protein [Anaerolineales bacterium]
MANDNFLLELRNIHAGYGEIEVLKDVSIRVRPGEIVSILGANGAGKSTLMRTIFGIIQPRQGKMIYEGENITHFPSIEKIKCGISYAPEGRSNFPGMTVQENLEMGAYTRRDQKQIQADTDALCERFPILKMKRNTPVGNLSGGQQQMVEIAMAMMLKPKILLIDEPTLGLAPILVSEVFDIIKEINAGGTTVLLVEQNAKRALEISHYAFVLELGRVRMEGDAQELVRNEEVILAYLGER